jgi:hypothetical protein
MKTKLTLPVKKKKTSRFLLNPRYCEGCYTRFWLERVPLDKFGYPKCPDCHCYLWYSKETARDSYEEKLEKELKRMNK